jgi:succinate dehydrogenase / fumarate reductase, flavoprotein subunit
MQLLVLWIQKTVFYKDWTGEEIIRVLMEQVQQRKIEIKDHIYITRLLKSVNVNGEGPAGEKEGEVKGAIGIDIEKKEIVIFDCKSLILAAGGYTRVYSVSSSRIFETMEKECV